MTPAASRAAGLFTTRRKAGFFVFRARGTGRGEVNEQRLVPIGAMDGAGARRRDRFALHHDLGGFVRNRRRRHRRQYDRPAAERLDQLHRRRRRRCADVSGGDRHRSARGEAKFRFQRHHRLDGILRALSRLPLACALRARLAVAAGADRRHCIVYHLGRGGLCRDGRNRLQPDRARQDHPRRLLHQ